MGFFITCFKGRSIFSCCGGFPSVIFDKHINYAVRICIILLGKVQNLRDGGGGGLYFSFSKIKSTPLPEAKKIPAPSMILQLKNKMS